MDLQALSSGLADAVERSAAGIVTVNGRSRQTASGIVWSDDVIVTADHVLERDEQITIFGPDGTEYPAEVAGRDPGNDVAVLRVTGATLTVAARAQTEPRVGQLVLAVGRPHPSSPQASLGLINSIGGPVRRRRGVIQQYFRTDATPYPGFSGGALVNLSGEVVGLFTSALAGGEPVGIPTAALDGIVTNLLSHGRIRRGFLGISSQTIPLPANQRAGRNQEAGLLIVHVDEHSPAAQGGLLVGDLLVGIEGQAITDPYQLQDALNGDRVGTAVAVEVIRGDQLLSITVTVGERPKRRH